MFFCQEHYVTNIVLNKYLFFVFNKKNLLTFLLFNDIILL